MITGADVLQFLIPTGGWAITGNDYDEIIFCEATPITKEEFEAGFDLFAAWKAEQAANKAAEKSALLAKLGLTEEEAKLLLS